MVHFLVVDDNSNDNNDSITGGSGDDIFRLGDNSSFSR